ncbi:MAG TPA: hypothetical protein VKU91_04830, partial [Acidimicrobiales bacterium]|nr:hypothetical protein [Acidimicrobiales bacterium]
GSYIFPSVSLPITLTAAQTWKLNGADLGFFGTISGNFALTMAISNQAQPSFFSSVGVTSLTVTGSDVINTGNFAGANGYVDMQQGSSLNAPLTVSRTYFSDYGSGSVGSLTTSGANVTVGVSGPGGTLPVQGNLTLDARSVVTYSGFLTPGTAGTNYPQITSSGTTNLGDAQLGDVYAQCNQTAGTAYTLVSASGGLTGEFYFDNYYTGKSGPIANGDIVQTQPAPGSCQSAGATPPELQISYTSNSVVATVVAPAVARPASPPAAATLTRDGAGYAWRVG